jgi:hypothetical protein
LEFNQRLGHTGFEEITITIEHRNKKANKSPIAEIGTAGK